LYRRNSVRYLVLFLAAGALGGLVNLVIQRFFPIAPPQLTGSILDQTRYQILAAPQSILTVIAVSPISSVSNGTGVGLASDMIEKESSSLGTSLRLVVSRIRQVLYVTIVTGVLISLGYIFFLPGLIFDIIFFLAVPVVLLENVDAITGIRRSQQLVSKRWGKTFVLFLILGLISAIPTYAITFAFPLLNPDGILVLSVVGGFLAPLSIISSTTYYYSNKARVIELGQPLQKVERENVWVCKNCGTSIIMKAMPSKTAFGGCLKAKRSMLQSAGKHEWVSSQADVGSYQIK
jgi:hypothetical protein